MVTMKERQQHTLSKDKNTNWGLSTKTIDEGGEMHIHARDKVKRGSEYSEHEIRTKLPLSRDKEANGGLSIGTK